MLIAFTPYLKVLAAFLLMLLGIRNRLGLALSIYLGGVVLGLVFHLELPAIATTGIAALAQEKFLLLITIVGLIMILSDALERSGQSRRLMTALSGYLVTPRLRLIFFPALIGLLPMPGGAIFSAPMVKTMGESMQLRSEAQALINYWFRHVWEMAWPLYPGIILTVALADIPLTALISKTWPGVIAMFVFGWLFFLQRFVPDTRSATTAETTRSPWREVAWQALPLLVAIVGAIAGETLLAWGTEKVSFEWGVIAALLAAVATVMVQNRLGLPFLGEVLAQKRFWSMLLVIVAIFTFKDTLQAAGVVEEMAKAGGGTTALLASAVFLPFLVGMVAGINVAFVGATFPLLIGLLANLGLTDQLVPYLVLASFAGFTGVMISPIHICFILTCNYFGADPAHTWRQLIAPCLAFAICGGMLFFALRLI